MNPEATALSSSFWHLSSSVCREAVISPSHSCLSCLRDDREASMFEASSEPSFLSRSSLPWCPSLSRILPISDIRLRP